MKSLKRLIAIVVVLLIMSYLGISYMLSNRVLTPNSSMERTIEDISVYWNTTFEDMMALLPPPTEVNIKGYEDVDLYVNYFNVSDSAECVFIFVHGWGRNWPNMLKYYPMVEDCGCNILMYDHRGHGQSSDVYPTGGIKEGEDLLLVTEWVSDTYAYDWDQIAWFGSSWGAATSLMAGANDRNPAFIIADAPFQNWYSAVFERAIRDYGAGIKAIAPGVMQIVNMRAGIDYKEASALEKTKNILEPVLLIHSEADPETGSNQSVNISKNLNDRSTFHHTKWGNKHVMDVINNREEMRGFLNDFIVENQFTYFQKSETPDSTMVN